MPDFVHLHNHTHYSLLDAATTPQELVDYAVADGQKAIAITDHGVMFGCYEFYKIAKKAGIKPIIGFEAYLAAGTRFEKPSRKAKEKNYYHLVLLAKNQAGYHNLMKLSSLGHTEGFHYKPRIDKELLEKHSEGLIVLSACIAGVVNAHLINGDYEEAKKEAKYFKDLFGDDFYIELQNHSLIDDQIILRDAPRIAQELGIKVVATNDIHYLKKEHSVAHNVHLLIRDSTSANSGTIDIQKLKYRTPEMYFKTAKQMAELFKDTPEALTNTVEIADKCNMEIDTTLQMPVFPIPPESKSETLAEYLEELTNTGLKERYGELTPEIEERAKYELKVINDMGFPGYFLIVEDFIRAAVELGVRVGPGRGSAAGSLVAFALKITNVDPLEYDLLFERFLNPERVNMPDIDIDFADDKRDLVIQYVKQKYGEEAVSMIITFGKLSTKAVLKDVGRVLGIPHGDINAINRDIPSVGGKVTPLKKAIELPELSDLKNSHDPKIRELIDYSLILEGKYRNCSTHACGVVIAPGPISDFVPLYKSAKTKDAGVDVVSQYNMANIEDAGLLKMDFLGLRTLSIIENTLTMIEENYGKKIDIDNPEDLDLHDQATYDLLSNGDTQAVFQFESQGMQEYLKQLKPQNLEELTAMNALYRPGPMGNIPEFIDRKHGRKPIEYLAPIMEKSLKNTYGIIVYQEQVMQLARDIGGFSLGGADILRRAMGKKKKKVMAAQKPKFLKGAAEHNIPEKIAIEIFELIEKFAEYGFNKSHSLAYSYLAYQTAWLKTHYPAEFLAANMTAEQNDQDKVVKLIEEAAKFDLEVVPPDVNKSFAGARAHDNKIFFGLAAIRNVGTGAVEGMIEVRKDKPFISFFDFVSRADTKLINRRALEALICAGAFSTFDDNNRAAQFEAIDSALDYSKALHNSKNVDMDSLFGGAQEASLVEPTLSDIPDWTERERLTKEKEVLSFYISGNPMERFRPYIDSFGNLKLDDFGSKMLGNKAIICGMITALRTQFDSKGRKIAFATVEDFKGKAKCILWSKEYSNYGQALEEDSVVIVEGNTKLEGEEITIFADKVTQAEEYAREHVTGYSIRINLEEISLTKINDFNAVCNDASAVSKITFTLFDKSQRYMKRLFAREVKIDRSPETIKKVIAIFGRDNVKLATFQ